MERNLDIETITKGLLVIQRIKQLYNPAQRDAGGQTAEVLQSDRLSLLQDTLTSISDIFPATRGGSFSEAFKMGSHYSSTYRGIKQHFREMGNGVNNSNAGIIQLAKTLKVIAPALNSRQKVYMDKVVKIFDILVS